MCKIDKATNERMKLRLAAAQYLNKDFRNEFNIVIGEKITELSEITKKKPRYYPNSINHRQKLRYLQTLIFCETLEKNVLDALLHELLFINNQLNITYLLEIIIAQHYTNILSLFDDELATKDFKSQALKSIVSIALIQMRRQTNFEEADKILQDMFKKLFPLTMGQNFGVRIYSQLALTQSLKHVKTLENFKETPTIQKFHEIAEVIYESVKQKNCSKYFNALKNDFRFSKSFDQLFTINSFYHQIPLATNMPFEETIVIDEMCEPFEVVEMSKEDEQLKMCDEMEVPALTLMPHNDGNINLQQKYLPFKYQIPGNNLIDSLPNIFNFYDEQQQLSNKHKSDLIVICSLIDRHANLGGLARTCEIFGTSEFVVNSLKVMDNLEFKSLSKTAEKWIRITEIKHWQLFDYLLAMKQKGYKIIGAEQSGNSVSLENAAFPRKCVLLLG